MKKSGPLRHSDVQTDLTGQKSCKLRNLNGMLQRVLTIAGPEFHPSKELDKLRMDPVNADFESCRLSFFPDHCLDFFLRFFHHLFDPRRMDPSIHDQLLKGDTRHFSSDGIETGKHNRFRCIVNYQIHADNGSMYNTPPCYAIYICKLVLEWVKNDMGGLESMKAYNEKKAGLLYDFLDSSSLFKGTVEKKDRSLMNIPFVTGNEELDAKFVKEAAAAGFVNLKGHRSVGGMRASIYNAMPIEGVEKLVAFMKRFEADNT